MDLNDFTSTETDKVASTPHPAPVFDIAWDRTNDGMRIVGDDGIVLRANDGYRRLIGKPVSDVEGRPFVEAYGVRAREEMAAEFTRLFQNRTSVALEEREVELWNGESVWHEQSHVMLECQPLPARVLTIIRDITGRKRLEQALRKMEETQNLLVEASDEGIWAWDLHSNDVFFSPRWKRMLGYEPHELADRHDIWLNLIHPDDREPTFARLRESCDGDHPDFKFEYRMQSREGDYLWILEKGRVIFDAAGVASRMIGSHVDITERKRADAALRESEEKFRQMAENIHAALWISEVGQGPVIYVNPAFEEVFGISRETLYSRPRAWMDLIHFDDHERVASSMARVIRTRSSGAAAEEFRISAEGGHDRWISARIFPISDETGRVYRFVVIADDVTDRKRMEEVLRESEERYRLLVQLSPDAIFIQSEGKIVFINDAGAALFGAESLDRLIGTEVVDLMHPDFKESARDRIHKLRYIKGKFPRSEEKYLRLDGTCFDAEVVAAPFLYQDRAAIQVVARDITERKRAEEKIREQADFLDKATDAIIVHDLKGQVIYWNRGGEILYGWTQEEALGRDLIELLEPKDQKRLLEILPKILANGTWSGELKQVTKNGSQRVVQSSCTLLRDPTGAARSVLMINRDVTENKLLEAQLLRSQRLESLGTLAGGIAHDLNNVLTPIMMSVEMLKGACEDSQSQSILDSVETAAARGAEIIKQLLTFARGLKGEFVLLQPKHLIKEMDPILKGTFPKSIEIGIDLVKDLWTVQADATQLHQVLLNLCVNARDAMPDGGKLSIRARNMVVDEQYARAHIDAKPGRYVLIAVDDSGSGISPENLDKIFDPFFTTKEVGRGTGLGLSTVLTIVKNHGGFLTVVSELGRGSSFSVFIPAAQGTEVHETLKDETAPRGREETILVVDDEAAVRAVLSRTLETHGYKVLTAKDGAEAVSTYAREIEEISAVITDIMMPVLDGPATIRALRNVNPDVRFLVITGLTTEAKLQEIKSLGIEHILHKPFKAEKLLKALQQVIRKPTDAPHES